MSNLVIISHAPEDRAVAELLAGDLERQGVRAVPGSGDEQSFHAASALVTMVSVASTTFPMQRAEAERAASAGKPIHAVRVADVGGEVLSGLPVASWSDAFGPDAQASVARLAHALRSTTASGAPGYGAPGYGAAGSYGASAYGAPPAPRSGKPPAWLAIVGGVAGLVLIVVGILQISGAFGGRSRSASSNYSSGSGTDTSGSSNQVTMPWLNGTWGPNCPNSTNQSFQLVPRLGGSPGGVVYADGSSVGTWTLSGNQVTTVTNTETRTTTWTRIGPNTASVALAGRGSRTLTRCGNYTGA